MADQPGTKIVEVPPPTTMALPPVPVTLIGTMKDIVPTTGTVATVASAASPNLVVQVVTPFVAILVRAINLFLVSLSGFVTAGLTPSGSKMLGGPDFFHLIVIGAGFAIAPVGIGVIKDLITVFGKLEQQYPLATGSI